jgi:hypothetical protein
MVQTTLTWLGATHAPPHSLLGGNLLGLPSPWVSVGFLKKKSTFSLPVDSTCALHAPFVFLSLLLINSIYTHAICLGSSMLERKNQGLLKLQFAKLARRKEW